MVTNGDRNEFSFSLHLLIPDFLGCFMDNTATPVFTFNLEATAAPYSAKGLPARVWHLFFRLAAVRYGQQCFCARRPTPPLKSNRTIMCCVPFTARGDMKCDGVAHFAVYNVLPESASSLDITASSQAQILKLFNATFDVNVSDTFAVVSCALSDDGRLSVS